MSIHVKSARKLRMEITEVAAKLIAIEGVADYRSAKRKAAIQLGLTSNRNLPTNQEIEQALINYQNLFQSDSHVAQLRALRLQAIQAMKLLSQFKPVLAGPVATGTATSSSEVTLHLYSDQVERVGMFLSEQGIPNSPIEKYIRINTMQNIAFPAYRFFAGSTSFVLVIFSENDKNLCPLSATDNKALKTLDVQGLMRMVETGCDSTPG